jgi:hypothetical protein
MGLTPYRTNARPIEPPKPPRDYTWIVELVWWSLQLLAMFLAP